MKFFIQISNKVKPYEKRGIQRTIKLRTNNHKVYLLKTWSNFRQALLWNGATPDFHWTILPPSSRINDDIISLLLGFPLIFGIVNWQPVTNFRNIFRPFFQRNSKESFRTNYYRIIFMLNTQSFTLLKIVNLFYINVLIKK